jgi:hypothetical protein
MEIKKKNIDSTEMRLNDDVMGSKQCHYKAKE